MISELKKRILVLDGAMGTMIQRYNLTEEDFRGNLKLCPDVKYRGCNDLLCLTRPDIISEIHWKYLNAGADIIETNSFNANAVSLAEYHLQPLAARINEVAARLARVVADTYMAQSVRKVFVAGSMGPGNIALSIPSTQTTNGENDGVVDFDTMSEACRVQAHALIQGGVDALLLETIFDTLNAKAAVIGIRNAMKEAGREVPLMLSVTLTESGRTLSGQTIEAFVASVRHSGAVSIGLNCGFGAEGMAPWLEKFQDLPLYISLHPNAGLPDEMGRYVETPEKMAATMRRYLEKGQLNIAGGCCGTTPEHIAAIAAEAHKCAPRIIPQQSEADNQTLSLAGMERLDVNPSAGFLKVGERCNVAGSRKFLRLVNEGNLAEALEIASAQIGKGAKVLDINMDDAMLDAAAEMERFVTLLTADNVTSRYPLMIDSSNMDVIRRALRKIQGVAIVNSISLKEGEEKFIARAREIRGMGGAVVVMAFDEEGQATTLQRRIDICQRAYKLLTGKCDIPGAEIIFDPNVLTIATGVAEHDRYALDFLEATEWIKHNLPGAKVSGGVSNLSFAFRGHNKLRESMHTVFLHHAIERGMDMAIVNPATSIDIETVEPTLREAIEDLIFCRRPDAVERLLGFAVNSEQGAGDRKQGTGDRKQGAGDSKQASLEALVEKGIDFGIEPLLEEALTSEGSAMGVVKNRLMAAMQRVGDEFGAGRMFLPQVVRSASVMKRAIEYLTPIIERENKLQDSDNIQSGGNSSGGKFVLATVKGDVHDIGKNIVGVILKCSGFDVIDLGVMVEAEDIVRTVKESGAQFVGLSGLITPSLTEMCDVADMLEHEGLNDVTLCVGGATTSELHTAVKIAPLFSGVTLHTRDAAQLPPAAAMLADKHTRVEAANQIKASQERLRKEYAKQQEERNQSSAQKTGTQKDIKNGMSDSDTKIPAPVHPGVTDIEIALEDVIPFINWKAFLYTWKIPLSKDDVAASMEAERLVSDAKAMLTNNGKETFRIKVRVALLPAHSSGDDIIVKASEDKGEREIVIPLFRQESEPHISIADFISDKDDYIGFFAVSVETDTSAEMPDYEKLLRQSVADRLVEAATEFMHKYAFLKLWGLELRDGNKGIRPAVGYPSLPDQSLVFILDEILNYSELGISLTENGALSPSSTTTGLLLPSPEARYFEVGKISEAQLQTYAKRRGLPLTQLRRLLPK